MSVPVELPFDLGSADACPTHRVIHAIEARSGSASTESAVARGLLGASSSFVGPEPYFGKDRLREVEQEFLRSDPAR